MKFKIGDIVRLREDHPFERCKQNPLGIVGTVISAYEVISLPLAVLWSNGTRNSYENEHLLPATKLDKLLAGIENAD
jgi:hypothetical protein